MQRITISIDDDLATAFDAYLDELGYNNRSEAFRDLIRNMLAEAELKTDPDIPCVGVLSYAFSHHERQLATRMTEHQHAHTGQVISTMHVHATHDECVESVVIRGTAAEVRDVAQKLSVEPGIRHGILNIIPIEDPTHRHEHAADHVHDHEHTHAYEHEHAHEDDPYA